MRVLESERLLLQLAQEKDFEYLLLTNPGEWPMVPDMGIGLERTLFQNSQQIDIGELKQNIQLS